MPHPSLLKLYFNFRYWLFLGCLFFTSLGVYSQILSYETKISVDNEGSKYTEKKIQIKVDNKESNWLAHVEISHNPMQNFSLNYARITDLDGNLLRKFKPRELKTRSDLSNQAFYQDDLISEFDLYWDQYPYLIEYSYSIEESEFINVAWWTPMLYKNATTYKSSLEITIPTEYQVKISKHDAIEVSDSNLDGIRKMSWRFGLYTPPENELYAPPLREFIPYVWVVPMHFHYGIEGSFDSWDHFGKWISNLNEGTDILPFSEKSTIDELIKETVDKKEKAKKLYYYLQDHTKYINVAIDVGGLKTYPASYVSKNKYGDCKALTTYMKSMLKYVGIESVYTIIYGGPENLNINKDFPGQQFNHVILSVPFEKDTLWLENTSNSLPFNYLGNFTHNRLALSVNDTNSRLVKTPQLLPEHVLIERQFQYLVDQNQHSKSTINLKLRGNSFEYFRHAITNLDRSEQEAYLIKQVNLDGFTINDWELIDYNRDSTHIEIAINGYCSKQVRKIGNWNVINPLRIVIPEFEKPTERQLNVKVTCPINKLDRAVYHLNSLESQQVQLPDEIEIETDYGYYSTLYVKKGDAIEVIESFVLKENEIPIEDYTSLYDFLQAIIEVKKKSAILIQ
ncbi:MAG: DUF3857 domain-containing protein [Cyclobacteriaceae bacterium]